MAAHPQAHGSIPAGTWQHTRRHMAAHLQAHGSTPAGTWQHFCRHMAAHLQAHGSTHAMRAGGFSSDCRQGEVPTHRGGGEGVAAAGAGRWYVRWTEEGNVVNRMAITVRMLDRLGVIS
ncbi:unnamed protein product [Closterium sp. NIES-64]|nr:unnamed protein product [Closterium sp. NIES-64]